MKTEQMKIDLPKRKYEIMKEASARAIKLSKAAAQLNDFKQKVVVRVDEHGASIKLPSQVIVSGVDYDAATSAAVAFKVALESAVEKMEQVANEILLRTASDLSSGEQCQQ